MKMKKTLLTLVFVIVALMSKAQYPEYDTFYVYHPPGVDTCDAIWGHNFSAYRWYLIYCRGGSIYDAAPYNSYSLYEKHSCYPIQAVA